LDNKGINLTNEKKLVLWFGSDYAGCGFLRTVFPNDLLNATYSREIALGKYEGIVSSRFFIDKVILKSVKAIHFQRQLLDNQIRFIELLWKLKKDNPTILDYKIIYDTDDLFSEIPKYNYCAQFVTPDKIDLPSNIQRIKNSVDLVTTSTRPLLKKIKELGDINQCKFEVVPNYIPKHIYGTYNHKPKNVKPRILWAGSTTHYCSNHKGDFEPIYDLVKNTVDEFDWVFFGIRKLSGWIEEFKGKVKIMKWTSILEYPSEIKKVNADFGVAPLIENSFNESKSNIKFLDYASSDLVAMCSNVEAYRHDAKEFITGDWKQDRSRILEIFNNDELRQEILEKQRRTLSKYWLENNIDHYLSILGIKTGGDK
jgi:hypothetical protein